MDRQLKSASNAFSSFYIYTNSLDHCFFQGIEGVSKITDGYNPATWMLEVSSSAQELTLGVDFANAYRNSDLYKYILISNM
jgi:hypothetical protein